MKGGIYVIEVKLNKGSGLWHPHLHIVYDGVFIPQRELAEAWSDVVGYRAIVWINSACRNHGKYLAKYVGKPDCLHKLSESRIAEYAIAVDGLRMVQPFGTAHGVKVSDKDKREEAPPIAHSVSLSAVCSWAKDGHIGAVSVLRCIADRWPILRPFVPKGISLPPPDKPKFPRDDAIAWNTEFARILKFVIRLIQFDHRSKIRNETMIRGIKGSNGKKRVWVHYERSDWDA